MAETEFINKLVDQIAVQVRGGRTPEDAAAALSTLVDSDAVGVALKKYRELTGHIRTLREPGSIIDSGLTSWYIGPSDEDKFWPAYKNALLARRWQQDAIDSLDQASTKVVSLLSPPGLGRFSTRGLVLGYVQSGKTANFTAVISKAVDVGYRLVIVLSGTQNALRRQTQRRLDADLVQLNPNHWIALTDETSDFSTSAAQNVNAFLANHSEHKVLAVVKKNSSRLQRLKRWLRGAREQVMSSCPVLVIDDEADQASPNAHPDPDERTKINQLLVQLLSIVPRAAYVGYTATPFANFFIDPSDPQDLYPRDFIVNLDRPSQYFGAERLFGRDPIDGESPEVASDGLDMIREVPLTEASLLVPATAADRLTFSFAVPPSLAESLRWFWMATAARHARNQASAHSSMLIHTSQYSAVHRASLVPIRKYTQDLLKLVRERNPETMETLQTQWEREQATVSPANFGLTPVSWTDVDRRLENVLAKTEVKEENSISIDRIDYESAPDRIYIVVGGNVLARGLTLEGLIVSFFVRTASAYDTLLQMGRWFGYRPGYEDLPRVWMTHDLARWFRDMATVEQEIRRDIERYENGHITPLDFGVRVRTHPHLAITAKLKMQHAVSAQMSFSGSVVQTLVFKHLDAAWLGRNLAATITLLQSARKLGIEETRVANRPHRLIKEVDATLILNFLNSYQVHEHHVEMPTKLLRGYIQSQNNAGRLKRWNVAVVTREGNALGEIGLGLSEPINMVRRSRFKRGDPQFADVKALMSQADAGLDLDMSTADIQRLGRDGAVKLRDDKMPDRGLLILYPINRESTPESSASKDREPLNAVDDVIGLALVFPDSDSITPQSYLTVDLSAIPRETPEIDDDDATDIQGTGVGGNV